MPDPLVTRSEVRSARGLVLMLHGGAESGVDPVGSLSPAWWRSRMMMLQLQRGLHRAGLSVWLLRFRVRGWNAGRAGSGGPSPVPDARWALDRVRQLHGDLPVVLLGHSMGARTAAVVADDPSVVGVVGLAPWFPPGEPVAPLTGKHLVAAHGRADRVTGFPATAAFVRRAAAVAASAELVDMGSLDHYLVRGADRWNAVAREQVIAIHHRASASR